METPEFNDVKSNGYSRLFDFLSEAGVTLYTGVTGGGVIHFVKNIQPVEWSAQAKAGFLTLCEYSAGFVPLGYYLASGKHAAAVATTGAATKLLGCGLSDAKLHDIPAVYLVALSGKHTEGLLPLQDTWEHGSNMVQQLRAELPDSVFVLDNPLTLNEQLKLARAQLGNAKPVVLVLVHHALVEANSENPLAPASLSVSACDDLGGFVDRFRQAVRGKRLVVLVGEEMARYPNARALTTQLAVQLHAATVWTINGANAVSRDNPYGYGYIGFGGNDCSTALYASLNDDDVLLVLGASPDEYSVNLQPFTAGETFYLSNITQAYGQIEGGFQHRASGRYHPIHGALDQLLLRMIDAAQACPFANTVAETAPRNLNDQTFSSPRQGYVNMATLYQRLDSWWPADSIGFDDVCLAYKDRQYVTQRPHPHIRFYSLYRGSAMGGAFGAAIGAKLARPEHTVFLFTGDGCFRLFSGALGEVRELGIVIFLLNNTSLAIVAQGLPKILPEVAPEYYHAGVRSLDYCAIAKACGWDAKWLQPDLANLDDILIRAGEIGRPSLLIEVPVDAHQRLGSNPRLRNL
ncbi:thiamine pyrophosphate-dependent enzyme [Pectobacterium carotovorum]|uniref:thiamine pyrophosphate-dependent enzyme n=1 Tax=Pectobacterium carotovorum TaxID=554 RepID=UPI0029DDDBCB|nr:thiamine pyrophosphate-dependent enzyme [Pectobacterium carotovorum]MDX6916031.1 thiamine pyrophosphate-dependent enzyme [Pectobacterium carotovorum]